MSETLPIVLTYFVLVPIYLRLTEAILWPWWMVFAPLGAFVVIMGLLCGVAALVASREWK